MKSSKATKWLANRCLSSMMGLFFGLALAMPGLGDAGERARPRITGVAVEGATVVVSVEAPAGIRKVTLESRSRLGAGTWVPKAVQRLNGNGGRLTFRLPKSESLELMRVRADAEEPLPASFFAGRTNFSGEASSYDPALVAGRGGAFDALAPGAGENGGVPVGTPRAVVESDIWQIRGQTLYFFNQYRGLQVIDLSQPDAPVVRGTLALPAAGEQMYLLGDQHVVLLARNGCGWATQEGSKVLVVSIAGQTPQVVASVTVEGQPQESRLVGTALYLASQAVRRVTLPPLPDGTTQEQWEWGSVVSSIDLANPVAPVARGSNWHPGYDNVITATDRFLLVAVPQLEYPYVSRVQLLDISAPDGTMRPLATLTPAGRVIDKFKFNIQGDVLTVISEAVNWGPQRRSVSVLETYSLADPAQPRKLGEIEVGHGERLFATRFDGNRAYIVTFLRIDPLWVVDLSDPAHPVVSGELQVPGWSTYLQPLGDRLVAIGIDNSNSWRVAVSLFDVRDPARPALLAKIPLGENSSWSEATEDEKAFAVLPEAGLILVPYQGRGTNGYSARTQLIDLGTDTLNSRGVIEHQMRPRRATVYGTRVLSLSGTELLTVDATDRDHPLVTSTTELSWPVEQVLLSGDYLLEVTARQTWEPPLNACLRVVRATEPDRVLTRLELTNQLSVLGATLRENKLYLLQGVTYQDWWFWRPWINADGTPAERPTNQPVCLTVFDLGQLPALVAVAETNLWVTPLGYNPRFRALWPQPGVLAWQATGQGWYRWWGPIALDGPAGLGVARDAIWWPGMWSSDDGRFLAFDVRETAAPRFASDLDLSGTNQWWNYSEAFTGDGLVYVSHQSSEYLPGVLLPGQTPPPPVITRDPTGVLVTNQPPFGIWVTRNSLEVVDYADPYAPTVRPPVSIPGTLEGLSHNGALIYTLGQHYGENWSTDGARWLDACAYDGVRASLVASLPAQNQWSMPIRVAGATVFLGNPNARTLEAWTVSADRRFTRLSSVSLGNNLASELQAFGPLLAVETYADYRLYDMADPAVPLLLGASDSATCLGPYGTDLGLGDASATSGLWVPAQDYGAFHVPLKPGR